MADPKVLLDVWYDSRTNEEPVPSYHMYVVSSGDLRISAYAFRSSDGGACFMLTLPEEPHVEEDFQAVRVSLGDRRSIPGWEHWTLTFTLVDDSLLTAFTEVCSALVRRLAECSSWQQADYQISHVFDQFRRLVRLQGGGEKLIRGTIAELAAMPVIARNTNLSVDSVIDGWTGPFGAAQDYRLGVPGKAYEVKALLPHAHTVSISSQYQLDPTGLESISLVTVDLKPAARKIKDAIGLNELRGLLIGQASDPTRADQKIQAGLDQLGLSFLSDRQRQFRYAIGAVTFYSVEGDFPRVTAKQVAAGVENLSYKLDLGDLRIVKHKTGSANGFVRMR